MEYPIWSTRSTEQIFTPSKVSDLLRIQSGSTAPIFVKSFTINPINVANTYNTGNITETEYLSIVARLFTYINTYNTAPSYSTSSLGNIKFESMIYMFSQILAAHATYNGLPTQILMNNYT